MNSFTVTFSESLNHRIIDLLHEALVVEDPDFKIVRVNKKFSQLTGYSEEECVDGNSIEMMIPAEFLQEFTAERKRSGALQGTQIETLIVRKNQTTLRALIKTSPLTNDEDELVGSIVTLSDITESKRQLIDIKERDERLRFLMESTSEGIVIHDKGIIIDVNDAVLKMLGYSYEDLVGKPVFRFTSPKEHESMRELFRQKMIFHGEREIIDKQGKIHYAEIKSKSVIHQGRDLRVLTLKDISELREKKTEEQRLISIIEASPFIVTMMDTTGIRYLNAPGRKILGYEPDEDLNGLTIRDFMSENSAKKILREAMPAAIKHGIWEGQTTLKKKDGSEFFSSQIIIAHYNEAGEVDFFSSLSNDITDRIKAEQVLKENQERLRYFMEESLEAIIIHEQGTIIDFNTAASKIFGYDSDELRGQNILRLYDTSFHPEIKKQISRKDSFISEWTGVKKDGSRLDIEVYSRSHNYHGKDVRVVSILDISLRKQTERALRSSELMLNAAVEGTSVGIWEWNLVTDKVTFNEAWRKISGMKENDVPQDFNDWKETIHKDDLPGLLEKLKNHLYGMSPLIHHVYRTRRASGEMMVMETKGKLVRDENKMPALIVGTAIDITERQQMEDALRKSQAQLAALIENREEIIWSVDPHMKIVNYNKQFTEVYPFLFGIEFTSEAAITDEMEESMKKKWEERYEVCVKGESLKFVERFVMNEKETFVEFTANPIRLSDDLIIGVSVLGRNITQQIQFEQSLKEAKEFAEEANRTKSQFLANISHEIRTPMNGIMGFTDLLLQSKVNPRQKEYLEIVRYSSDSLLKLINDLLDISKIEAGKLSLVNREFDLHKLMREIIRSFKAKADEQHLKIVSAIDAEIPKKLVGDEMRLQQVFINLIGNAVKFSEHGTVTVRIKLAEKLKNAVRLEAEIEDQGIGIDKDKHQTIFEPFNQLGDRVSGKYAGTGLGLSIARRLVEMMEGKIGVESEPKKGSKFYFSVLLHLVS